MVAHSKAAFFWKIALMFLLTACEGPTGPAGPAGPAGPTTAVYGNGVSGNVVIDKDTNWAGAAPETLQFVTLTINAGVTLSLPTGMVIRCQRRFLNNGIINVGYGAQGGNVNALGSSPLTVPADPGLFSAAGDGGVGDFSRFQYGGRGGVGAVGGEAAQILMPGTKGGGGGGASGVPGQGSALGGMGGGALVVLAGEGIVNVGSILAKGTPAFTHGSGGGGGGIVILAAQISITSSGSVHVEGGDGGDGASGVASGGGGGGGIIHILAPEIDVTGICAVEEGKAGQSVVVTATQHGSGGGGGACAGNGGDGGYVGMDGQVQNPLNYGAGALIQSVVDPTDLFL